MTHKFFVVFTLALVIFASTTEAYDAPHGRFGIGVVLGEPTGISGKFWISNSGAIDALLGWQFTYNWMVAQSGYLHHFQIRGVSKGSLAAYIGAGGILFADFSNDPLQSRVSFAARVPLGLEYIYNPISFYAEVEPLVLLYPEPDFGFGGGIGFRFYF